MLSHGATLKPEGNPGQIQEIIEEELTICHQLLDFTKRKKTALQKGDIDTLLHINKEENVLVLRLKLLQEAREYCSGSDCAINSHDSPEHRDSENMNDIRLEKSLSELKSIARNLKNIVLKNSRSGNSNLGFITYSPGIVSG